MLSQRQRLSSQIDNDNYTCVPLQLLTKQRKSTMLSIAMKENIPTQNIFKSPKNSQTPSQYSQKIQLQPKNKFINQQLSKSPNMHSNYRILSLPLNENKENEIMNRPIPSYMEKHLAQIASLKQNQREEQITLSSRNISSPFYQQNQVPLSPMGQYSQSKHSPIPSSISSKILKERTSFLLKTPQNGIKLPQTQNCENLKGKTANGFFNQKLIIKNSSKYNNYLTPVNTDEVAQKVQSCPILFDEAETERSPQFDKLTPNKRVMTCRRTKLIFKKYMEDNNNNQQDSTATAYRSPDFLTATQSRKFTQIHNDSFSAEKEVQHTNNSFEKSEDFSMLKKYYGQKYEPKLYTQQDQKPSASNIKSKRLQMILKQRNCNLPNNNFTATNFLYEKEDMKPWENKNETFVNDQMDTSLQEILNQLS